MNNDWKMLKKLSAAVAMSLLVVGGANAQCNSWESYPDGVTKAKEQHVLYRDRFKAQNYAEAFPYWEGLFEHVQSPQEAPRRHFEDGITMYQDLLSKETDETKKAELMKTMISLYDQMRGCTEETVYDYAYQGYYMYFYGADYQQTLDVLNKAKEMGGQETPDMVFFPMANICVWFFGNNVEGFDADFMVALYQELKEIADHNIANNKDAAAVDRYKQAWQSVEDAYVPIIDRVFGCEYYVNKLKPQFAPLPKDYSTREALDANLPAIEEIMNVLKEKCDKGEVFYQEVFALYEPMKELSDSFRFEDSFATLTPLEKATWREKQGRTEEANKYYEEVLSDESVDAEKKADIAYKLAYAEYQKGSYSSARTYCRKALEFRPGWGDPHLLIGNMYASSGKRCDTNESDGLGRGLEAQVVVWAAMDEWAKAAKDPNTKAKANGQIAKYKAFMPSKKDLFSLGINEGSTYKVGCWINVTTTVRAAP